MSDSTKAALQRVLRYVFIPALVAVLTAIVGVLQSGTYNVDWNAVALIAGTAAIGGILKYLRDEFGIDVKVA